MSAIEPFVTELEREAATTRRLLERIPSDKLGWKPHPKSRSLGELAAHVARVQKAIAQMLQGSSYEVGRNPETTAASTEELLATFDESTAAAKSLLSGLSDADLTSNWSLTREGKPFVTMPKIAAVRNVILNHVYHHRGQLTVYLRLLDVPVPSVYGASADENPFM